MSLYIRGDYFLKSYTVLKSALVYDNNKQGIWLAYAKIILFFNKLCFYGRNFIEIAMASLNQYERMHYKARDITQSLEKHGLLSRHKWLVYVWYMHVISSAAVAAGLFLFSTPLPGIFGLPSAPGRWSLSARRLNTRATASLDISACLLPFLSNHSNVNKSGRCETCV